jgi:hypothetical protein
MPVPTNTSDAAVRHTPMNTPNTNRTAAGMLVQKPILSKIRAMLMRFFIIIASSA